MSTPKQRRLISALAAVPLVAALAACGGNGNTPAAGGASSTGSGQQITVGPDTDQQGISVAPDQGAIDLLPAAIKSAGQITVGIEANGGYPNSVQINGKQYGLTYDLAKEIAAKLNLKLVVQAGPFANLIPGLQAHRYDLSTSLYGDNPDREKVLDFVYAEYALGDVVVAGSKDQGKKLAFGDDLCGLTVGTTQGSFQESRLQKTSDACVAAGKPAITLEKFDSNPNTVLAAVSGRVDAVGLPLGAGAYAAKANSSKLTLGPVDNTIQAYSGSALPKGSDLKPAVQAAMVSLMQDGVWKKTLSIYGQDPAYPDISVVQKGVPYVAPSASASATPSASK